MPIAETSFSIIETHEITVNQHCFVFQPGRTDSGVEECNLQGSGIQDRHWRRSILAIESRFVARHGTRDV